MFWHSRTSWRQTFFFKWVLPRRESTLSSKKTSWTCHTWTEVNRHLHKKYFKSESFCEFNRFFCTMLRSTAKIVMKTSDPYHTQKHCQNCDENVDGSCVVTMNLHSLSASAVKDTWYRIDFAMRLGLRQYILKFGRFSSLGDSKVTKTAAPALNYPTRYWCNYLVVDRGAAHLLN